MLFLKQACLNYCFRAYLACILPGTRQARFQVQVRQRHTHVYYRGEHLQTGRVPERCGDKYYNPMSC